MIHDKITIGCVSMTHLGIIHSVAFAEKGFHLVCYDENAALVAQLQQHEFLVSEPQLDEVVASCAPRLKFTHRLDDLAGCDVVFIACDVPTDDKGNSHLAVIDELIDTVLPVLSAEASLVLLSQVPPGYTRHIKFDKNRLFYQVETLVFGRAIERALYPERYIVGANDPDKELPAPYLSLLSSFECPILKMRYESAELAKISINMFLVSSVTTTNILAEICETIGADWEEIAPALRLDKRIGPHAYLSPGLGIAGGNLERDLNTIIKIGHAKSTDVAVVEAWIKNSQHRRDWVLRCLQDNVFKHHKTPKICVLGLAYKPDTHSIKNSPSIALIQKLKDHQIVAHDPVVNDHGQSHVTLKEDCLSAIKGADVVIIMTPWAEYRSLTLAIIEQHLQGNIIIDPYRVIDVQPGDGQNLNYYCLGS